LGHREGQVRGEEGHPLRFAEDPDHAHRAAQVFEHEDLIVGERLALFAVEHDRERLRLVPERLGQFRHRAAAVSI
ncbi:hypothetical protein JKG47_24050, partial [Acidithiobacillus sp. MC6.1]|nr:hypothetical protein [Acidithiobacillus sp. MC6.1]